MPDNGEQLRQTRPAGRQSLDKVNGTRYELTRDAVVNAIEEELLEEFLRTFWTMK